MRKGMGQVKVRRIRKPHITDARSAGRLGLTLLLAAIALGGWGYLAFDITREKQIMASAPSADQPDADQSDAIQPSANQPTSPNQPSADQSASSADIARLEQRREMLENEIAALEQRSQTLADDRQAEVESGREAQDEIRQLQTENATLRSQVAFLNQLFGGDDGPIDIGDLALSRAGEDGVRYWFKVSRTDPGEDVLRGTVKIQVRGEVQGQERYFDLSELTDNEHDGHRLGFRHFQEIDGTLRLPQDLEPEELLIVVVPDDKATGGARRQFEWQISQDTD